jgi:dipeptidyl aminopeptidase/acylaminoacyl peptidase
MNVWIVLPPGFDPAVQYPALLYCQGGPQSAVSQFFSYRWNLQLMASKGYVVIAPCRRGMPGSGQAWCDAISGDWGGGAMQDLLDATDALAKEPWVDERRLGAVGASFGGYSVYWLAGKHNKRFKAFISHCGLFNLESFYGTTEEVWFPQYDFEGAYWQSPLPEAYQDFSPHRFVQNWDTPILVMHNELDFRVPISEGMQAFQAAQLRGIPSRFVYFPDEGHWMSKPQNSMVWQREFFSWLDRYLK